MTARVPRDCLLLAAILAGCTTGPWFGGHRVAVQGQLVTRDPIGASPHTVVCAIREPVAQATAYERASPSLEVHVLRRNGHEFAPRFLVLPVGAPVRFENSDEIYHRFFSSSEANGFELGTLKPGEVKELRFSQPGWIHVYCSLHAGKQATILVTPTRHFAVVDRDGKFRFEDLAPGTYVLETWREGRPPHRKTVAVTADHAGLIEFEIDELPAKGS